MAIPHARPGEVIDARPLGAALADARTTVLIKSAALEVMRLVVPRGKVIPPHSTKGEITVHCLEGRVAFTVGDDSVEMGAGDLLYLRGGQTHALHGLVDASLLVTITFSQSAAPAGGASN